MVHSSNGLGRQPLTLLIRVRIPYGSPAVSLCACSSAESERLPSKQRVGGSNPSRHTSIMETKVCSKCNLEKSIEDFAFKNKSRNIRHSACKQCTGSATAAHYTQNPRYYKDKAKERDKIVRTENLQFVIDYLKQHPCVDCGESDPLVLEFDHIRDKDKNVSRLVAERASLDRIKEEIEKCEVRCANCHRRKTVKQLGWYKGIAI